MKKIRILFFVLVYNLQAQPVLEATHFPQQYTADVYKAYTTGYTNGNSGPNQIWDYSDIELLSSNWHISLVSDDTEQLGLMFPGANYFYYWDINGYPYYDTYQLSATSFDYTGYLDWDLIAAYEDFELTYTFPYTYNTVFTDSYSFSDQTVTKTYDAYGTLITPYGTFNDVIRQKIEKPSGTTYAWINAQNAQTLLRGTFTNSQVLFFKDTTHLNILENQSQAFMFYPNPVQNDFTIRYENATEEMFVTVCNTVGQLLITNKKLVSSSQVFSLSDLCPGVYIVKITNSQHQVLHTQKIFKS